MDFPVCRHPFIEYIQVYLTTEDGDLLKLTVMISISTWSSAGKRRLTWSVTFPSIPLKKKKTSAISPDVFLACKSAQIVFHPNTRCIIWWPQGVWVIFWCLEAVQPIVPRVMVDLNFRRKHVITTVSLYFSFLDRGNFF